MLDILANKDNPLRRLSVIFIADLSPTRVLALIYQRSEVRDPTVRAKPTVLGWFTLPDIAQFGVVGLDIVASRLTANENDNSIETEMVGLSEQHIANLHEAAEEIEQMRATDEAFKGTDYENDDNQGGSGNEYRDVSEPGIFRIH
jgi:hypothetical protein